MKNAPLDFIFTPEGFRIDKRQVEYSPFASRWLEAFTSDRYLALWNLGFEDRSSEESPSMTFLHLISEKFLSVLTDLPELELARGSAEVPLTEDTAAFLLERVPFALGTEFVTEEWLSSLFSSLREVFSREIAKYEGTVSLFLTEKSQKLRVPERVFFHLVEHPKTPETPFAFLATYAALDENGKVRHRPLSYALTEMGGSREQLLSLLSCLNGAAEACPLIATFMQNGELFHPLKLTSQEAYSFLRSIPAIEEAGILCRVPNWWKKRSSSVSLSIVLGEGAPSFVGADTLLSMRPRLMVNGEYLTEEEIQQILSESDGLALIKGKWVEVDREKLKALMEKMQEGGEELSLFEALRMQAGLSGKKEEADVGDLLTNGQWLASLLKKLRTPTSLEEQEVSPQVSATLRPYQKTGYSWLCAMQYLGFGACLADDMGLGKTLQVLTWLERLMEEDPAAKVLLVVPASLLGNWQKEAERFTPGLSILLLHGSSSRVLSEVFEKESAFLTITTYSMVSRIEALHEYPWTAVILDEAQAIKNPGTKQTHSIKELKARYRIALTGTPIENDLTNLWSLFDFLNKGLLGSSAEFKRYAKSLSENPDRYVRLKSMVSPFILRRLKTDKSIISDLPEKVEAKDYVSLSKRQLVLYRKLVEELSRTLSETDESGIKRKGIVLGALTKFKQICNHPDLYHGEEAFDPSESGKFLLLKDICETIYEKRERVLVFTQFREMTKPLAAFLSSIFEREGLILDGSVPVKNRPALVEQFNGEDYVPFMVLTIKAGGTGLNLTAANHVIHFDRWWNPAVENQATDRAFRIGQKKNVIVHKLISEGTIEEKIDAMIESKRELAESIIAPTGENWITELGNEELLSLLKLEG